MQRVMSPARTTPNATFLDRTVARMVRNRAVHSAIFFVESGDGSLAWSGAFAFHNPQRDLYFTGTVNQLSGFGHGAAVSAMVRVTRAVS